MRKLLFFLLALIVTVGSATAQKTITGKVTDNYGSPLPGVTIVVKGTTTGTITSSEGEYSLGVPNDAETLVFSFIGMKVQEVSIGNQTTLDVQMETDVIGIEEVVAIGYGTMKRSDLTGSVASVRSEDIENEKPQAL